jgi:hypothetical protein
MSVEIENASINSVQVSINVVKIGQKQMTQAVFNQLYEEKPWDDYYNITQFLWGKVNYKGTDYIVFQSDNELRKYEIPKKIEVLNFMNYFRVTAEKVINRPKVVELMFDDALSESQRALCKRIKDAIDTLPNIRGKFMYEDASEIVSLEDFEAVMEANSFKETLEKAKAKKWWDEKYNSLVNELNSQKQLFIAV